MMELLTTFVQAVVRVAVALEKIATTQANLFTGGFVTGSPASLSSEAGQPGPEGAQGGGSESLAGEPQEGGKRARPTKEVIQARRAAAVAAIAASAVHTLAEVEAQIKAPHDKWTTEQCRRVFTLVGVQDPTENSIPPQGQPPAQAPQDSSAGSTQAPGTPPQEQLQGAGQGQQEQPQAPGPDSKPQEPAADKYDEALFTFIREQATAMPLTIPQAEELISSLSEYRPPTVELMRNYAAACCNNKALTREEIQEAVRACGRTPEMTDEQVAAINIPSLPESLRSAAVYEIARSILTARGANGGKV